MIIEESSGGVVINSGKVVVVYQANTDTWALPKGHIDENESILETAKREILEETGISKLKFIKKLGSYERKTKRDINVIKKINILLFTTQQDELNPTDEINPVAKWISIDKVADLLSYKEDRAFFFKIKDELRLFVK